MPNNTLEEKVEETPAMTPMPEFDCMGLPNGEGRWAAIVARAEKILGHPLGNQFTPGKGWSK